MSSKNTTLFPITVYWSSSISMTSVSVQSPTSAVSFTSSTASSTSLGSKMFSVPDLSIHSTFTISSWLKSTSTCVVSTGLDSPIPRNSSSKVSNGPGTATFAGSPPLSSSGGVASKSPYSSHSPSPASSYPYDSVMLSNVLSSLPTSPLDVSYPTSSHLSSSPNGSPSSSRSSVSVPSSRSALDLSSPSCSHCSTSSTYTVIPSISSPSSRSIVSVTTSSPYST